MRVDKLLGLVGNVDIFVAATDIITGLENALCINIVDKDMESIVTFGEFHAYLIGKLLENPPKGNSHLSPEEVWKILKNVAVKRTRIDPELVQPDTKFTDVYDD